MKWVCAKCFMPRETDGDHVPGICSMPGCYGHFVPEDSVLTPRQRGQAHQEEIARNLEDNERRKVGHSPHRFSEHLLNVGPSDMLNGSFDNAAGRSFDSRAERKRYYREHQLRRTSIGEARRNGMEGMDHKCLNQSISYAGQKDRRSSAEKHSE